MFSVRVAIPPTCVSAALFVFYELIRWDFKSAFLARRELYVHRSVGSEAVDILGLVQHIF